MLPKKIVSKQSRAHPKLALIVKRHSIYPYQRKATLNEKLQNWLEQASISSKLILDAGCGTGESSYQLALKNSDAEIIAVDKSIFRLSKGERKIGSGIPENLYFLRANLLDFWMQTYQSKIKFDLTYLLYPNPWPKKKQLMRRWHAHPVFPYLLKTTKRIILRTNWKVYLDEFKTSLEHLGYDQISYQQVKTQQAISPFEKKYAAANHELFELEVSL